jgi:signal transduction histidine kinase/PAS domain-containing protein
MYLKNGGNNLDYAFNNGIIEPYLYSSDSIIIEVSKEFIDLTGFTLDELIGKSLLEIGDMLKINSQVFLDNISSNHSAFIFTKLLDAREVNIRLFKSEVVRKKKYTFSEKPNSRLSDKLLFIEQLFKEDDIGVTVFSVPDFILLKVNQKYLDFLDAPYNKIENSLGRPIKEIITGFKGSEAANNWDNILQTQKNLHIREFKFNFFNKGVTYWDAIYTPVFENGQLKYIFEQVIDVTDKVSKNDKIERQNKVIHQQKEQLEQQNIKLVSIIENLCEAVVLTDNKGKIIMSNQDARLLIYQFDKLVALEDFNKYSKYMDMEGNEISAENMPGFKALRGEIIKNTKMLVNNPDSEYYLNVSSIPIYNAYGDLTMVISCFRDITETVLQSKKINEQKKELEAIIENIADGIYIIDNKGRYILSNKSAREMFQVPNEYFDKIGDVYNKSEFYNIEGERISLENIPASRVMRGEKVGNTRMAIKFPYKTLQIDISGTPIYDNEGKFTLGVFCCRDMTDYFNHIEAIRGRHEFLNRMIDTFDLPVLRLSCPDLMIVDINNKALDMAKMIRTELRSSNQSKANIHEDLFKIFMESDYYEYACEVLKEKKTKYLNKKAFVIDGDEMYWNIIMEPMFNVNGEIEEIIVLLIDVTAEVKSNIIMETTLKLQEEFFANVSHELKTPLNVIFATAQLLNMYCNNGTLDGKKASIIKYIDSIKQNSYRLSKLINNIVDLSKIEAGFFELNLSNNNIVEVVEEIVMSVTNYTESKGLNIIFDTDTEEIIIACDPEKIERIVLNLISNAIKFSEAGDEILVDIKYSNDFVEISVQDNGIGIEVHQLNIIFDRFKQVDKSLSRNAQGTGIGLSLVKSIVELHGGRIYVESIFGMGSKFTVILPTRKVMQENMLFSSKIRNKSENIQVELSDVCS